MYRLLEYPNCCFDNMIADMIKCVSHFAQTKRHVLRVQQLGKYEENIVFILFCQLKWS